MDPSEDSLKPVELSEQAGYSQRNESNSLKVLERSLPDQTQPTASTKSSRSLLVNFLKGKFRATAALLPEPVIVNQLVDLFFVEANPHVGVLDPYFYRKFESRWNDVNDALVNSLKLEGLSRDVLYFPAVLFQVLAVALQYLTLDSRATKMLGFINYSEIDDLSQKYTQYGMEMMKLLGRHSPTLMSVQHDLMRAFWAKNCSSGTESWYVLGDAIRQAQDLGLHLQSESSERENSEKTVEALWYDEWKRRIWLSLFNWDAHMALVLGRPRSINAGDCTVDLPLSCDMPESPTTTVPTQVALLGAPSHITRHLFNNFICHKTHEMLSLGANRRYVKDYGVVKRLHDDVLRQVEEMKPIYRPTNPDKSLDAAYTFLPAQREHIATFANSFLVALHRPHASVHEESRRVAITASLATLESQRRLFAITPSSHYRTFGASFYTVDAGLFLLTAILENPIEGVNLVDRIHSALSDAIARLNIMKFRNPMAESGVKLLERCFEKFQATTPKINGSFSHEQLPTPQQTPSVASGVTPRSRPNDYVENTNIDIAPDYTDFEWAFPANGTDFPMDFDLIGNVTDFNASFWTDQMASIIDSNAVVNETDESLWQFMVA